MFYTMLLLTPGVLTRQILALCFHYNDDNKFLSASRLLTGTGGAKHVPCMLRLWDCRSCVCLQSTVWRLPSEPSCLLWCPFGLLVGCDAKGVTYPRVVLLDGKSMEQLNVAEVCDKFIMSMNRLRLRVAFICVSASVYS